ncbi:MAG: N-acetyltransferase [Beijerinckiaceae bacterium]|nr:N-acetyltransferase [Beijerinckiaceae bacterium]MCZ8300947.1 N-acetyltransferase [Beijerinckiaceae bacterium]
MTFIDTEKLFDIPAREALLDRAFGPNRRAKTCERLREGRLAADGLSFVARADDRVIATLRFWHVNAGGRPALMLGPIAVDPLFRSLGLGGEMIRHGLSRASMIGHQGVILVGDAPYYQKFGFDRSLAAGLDLPGPVDPARFLALELEPGALAGARGLVLPTGAIPLVSMERQVSHRRAA